MPCPVQHFTKTVVFLYEPVRKQNYSLKFTPYATPV